MVSKVASYYTTDEKYKAVGSNHLSKIKYDKESLTLWITFANNACYKYFGVPENLYKGLMASPSHGVFFWENIRQRFPYKNLGKSKDVTIDILGNVSKGHKKLNDLDKLETLANEQLEQGIVDTEKYYLILQMIEREREKAGVLLDKELGVYVSPAQKAREEKQRAKELALDAAIQEQQDYDLGVKVKKIAMGVLIASTLVFTFSHVLVGLIVLGILVEGWSKIK